MAVLSAIFRAVDDISPTLANIASKGENLNGTLTKLKGAGGGTADALAGIRGKSENLGAALAGVSTKSSSAANALASAGSSSRTLTQTMGEMSSKSIAAAASTSKWTDSIGNYDKSAMEAIYATDELVEMGFKANNAFEKFANEQDNYSASLGNTVDESDALAEAFKETEHQSNSMSNAFSFAGSKGTSLSGTLKKLAAAAAGVITVGAAFKFGEELTKSYIDFESGMSEVFTLLPGISKEAIGSMTEDLKTFSAESGVLTSESVPALYSALSAGVSQDTVFDFLGTANKAAIGGVTSIETAVDGLSSVVNAYGSDVLSADMASDYMFTTVKLGKTTFEELAGSLYNVVPTAVGAGVAFSDVSAALSAMTAQGVPTATATTQLRQTLVELSQSGTEVNELFGKLSGESFKQFIAGGGNLQDALILLEDHAQASNLGINDLFSSVEAGSAALVLTGTGTDKFTSSMDEMAGVAGATESAFSTMEDSIGYKVEKMQAKWEGFKLNMGENLAVAVSPVVDVLADNMEQLQAPLAELFSYAAESITRITPLLPGLADTLVSTAETVWSVAKPILDFVADNPDTVSMAIAGLGATIINSKVISGISGVGGAIGALGASLLAMPAVLGITAITAAIAGVGVVCYQVHKQAKEADLAGRFGDIALSMEEMDNIAERLVMNDNLRKSQQALSEFGKLDGLADNITQAGEALSKYTWTTEIGLTLGTDEMTDYLNNVNSYYQGLIDYNEQEGYATQTGLDVVLDPNTTEFVSALDALSDATSAISQYLTSTGEKWANYVASAFEDGVFDINEQKIAAELQSKLAAIQSAVFEDNAKAELMTIFDEYSGTALTEESFRGVTDRIQEWSESQKDSLGEAKTETLASYLTKQREIETIIGELNDQMETNYSSILDGMASGDPSAHMAYRYSGASDVAKEIAEYQNTYDSLVASIEDIRNSGYSLDLQDDIDSFFSNWIINTAQGTYGDELNTALELLAGNNIGNEIANYSKQLSEQNDFEQFAHKIGDIFSNDEFRSWSSSPDVMKNEYYDNGYALNSMFDQYFTQAQRDNVKDVFASYIGEYQEELASRITSDKLAGKDTALQEATLDQLDIVGAIAGDADSILRICERISENGSFGATTYNEYVSLYSASDLLTEALSGLGAAQQQAIMRGLNDGSGEAAMALKYQTQAIGIEANALGTTNSAEVFLAGEEGPEIVVGKPSSTVFPADVSAALLQLPTLNGASQTQLNAAKKITLEMLGNGSIKIDKDADKEEILTVLIEYLKPVLMDILSREILEEGDESYDF